jgi:hypothetical protein
MEASAWRAACIRSGTPDGLKRLASEGDLIRLESRTESPFLTMSKQSGSLKPASILRDMTRVIVSRMEMKVQGFHVANNVTSMKKS